jgi:DNA-binding NarL/FixJ family response regulator
MPEKPDAGSDVDTPRCESRLRSVGGCHASLSTAQRRVLDLILRGLVGEKQIAAHLHLSPTTVHNHRQAIYRIFEVHSRSKLILRVLAKHRQERG